MRSNQRFAKTEQCPTNEELLALLGAEQTGEPIPNVNRLTRHLAQCEFCDLTLELLRHHSSPAVSEIPTPPSVPDELQRLFPPKRV